MQKILMRGGVLLTISAGISKIIGFLRDRLIIEYFDVDQVDIIFTAFRIPDFFYYILVGATLSVIFIPKSVNLKAKEKTEYFSSFFWGLVFCFGSISFLGIVFSDALVKIFATGFDVSTSQQIASLSKLLFGSVFLLSISSLFSAKLQEEERFVAIGLAPVFYMLSITLGLFVFQDSLGILIVGFGAIGGALVHLTLMALSYFLRGGKIIWAWKKPVSAWNHFFGDFFRRSISNIAFQVNQVLDIWIASFLITGSVTAFSLGSNLGNFLSSVLGIPLANSAFPKLSKAQNQWPLQLKILLSNFYWIFGIALPCILVLGIYSEEFLKILFQLEGHLLWMTQIVFVLTLVSVPFGCMVPSLARVFLANEDTKTPLWATITSLSIATTTALILSLWILPEKSSIIGLAVGNFIANTLNFFLFVILLYFKYHRVACHSKKK